MEIAIALLALIATFYQLYLQRGHNEKSLKPLGQVDFLNSQKRIYVHIQNNGVGPLIIEKLTFIKDGKEYSNIQDCLDLDPKSYMHIPVGDTAKKIILHGSYLEIFSTSFDENDGDPEKEIVRKQLSVLALKADCRDIYDNKTTIERDFKWFCQHIDRS